MQKLKTEQVTKEYLYSAKMKMNLQRRSNLNPLGICDEFFFRDNFNDQKMHFIRTRKIFPRSRESFPCRVTFIWQRQFTAFVE